MAGTIEFVERSGSIEDEIAGLTEETTELAILAEDAFKNAAAALYGQEQEAAFIAIEHERTCAQMARTIHTRALTLLARHLPAGEEMRRILELQQFAAEFARIAEDATTIAEQALQLRGMAEMHLLRAAGDAPLLLLQLVRQAYFEVRGSIIATTARDMAIARRLVSEDGELDQLFLAFKRVVKATIRTDVTVSGPLQRLLVVGVRLEDIGNRVVAICHTLLYTPPPTAN
ncbi:MAG TPA: PhoU domain-containing protein [Ktedonobacterales bacterium]|nr:PhoU domain-containing protein [Ktedonobacterales bacterium]